LNFAKPEWYEFQKNEVGEEIHPRYREKLARGWFILK